MTYKYNPIQKMGREMADRRWLVNTNGELDDVGAENMSVSPAGALTFYNGNTLAVAYAPGAWTMAEFQEDES